MADSPPETDNSQVRQSVSTVIRRFKRLNPQGHRVIVGLSGGADSVALLKCLSLAQKDILAVHVVHDIRPKDQTDVDLATAKNAAKLCNVDFLSVNINPKKRVENSSQNVEAMARGLRYSALSMAAHTRAEGKPGSCFVSKMSVYYTDRVNEAVIATAHHADDQLETLIMRLARGSGLAGMSGIADRLEKYSFHSLVAHPVIRPMLDITRTQTEEICAAFNLPWIVDQTNLDEAYTRNKIRAQVVPVLKELYPKASEHATSFGRIVADANRVIARESAMFPYGDSDPSGPGNSASVLTDALRLKEDVVIHRYLYDACKSCCNGPSVNFDRINNQMVDDVIQAIRKRKTKTYFWPNRAIEVGEEKVVVRRLSRQEQEKQDNGFKKE